jgi:hypothetical protein
MRKWVALGVVTTVVIAGLVALGLWNRARFEAAVQPRLIPSMTECRAIVARHYQSAAAVESTCREAAGFPWFHITVRNTGHSPGYAYRWAHGYDRSGETVSRVAIPWGALGPGLPRVVPGQSVQGDWYFPVLPTGVVDH